MNLLPLPPFQETLNASMCGPATLKMLLMYCGLPGGEKSDVELAKECGTDPVLGTSNAQWVETAERMGLACEVRERATLEDIQCALERGSPVVVDWFSPGRKDADDGMMPDGHYSIVVGLDEKDIALQDPETGGTRVLPHREFIRVWFDFTGDTLEDPSELVLRWMCEVRKK